MRMWLCIVLAIVPTMSNPGRALADVIDPATLTQLMIEDEAQDGIVLGSAFGVDPNSPITFTSNLNVTADSFSYDSIPNALYLGLPLSIHGTGSLVGNSDTLTISSSIGLGATTISADGTILVNLAVDAADTYKRSFPSKVNGKPGFPVPGGTALGQVCDSFTFPSGRSVATCQYTSDLAGTKPFGPSFLESDFYPPKGGAWNVTEGSPDFAVAVVSTGFSPLTGGIGSFTSIVTVPEPATLPVLLLAAVALLPRTRRPRR
jgi:hypothetical protein